MVIWVVSTYWLLWIMLPCLRSFSGENGRVWCRGVGSQEMVEILHGCSTPSCALANGLAFFCFLLCFLFWYILIYCWAACLHFTINDSAVPSMSSSQQRQQWWDRTLFLSTAEILTWVKGPSFPATGVSWVSFSPLSQISLPQTEKDSQGCLGFCLLTFYLPLTSPLLRNGELGALINDIADWFFSF